VVVRRSQLGMMRRLGAGGSGTGAMRRTWVSPWQETCNWRRRRFGVAGEVAARAAAKKMGDGPCALAFRRKCMGRLRPRPPVSHPILRRLHCSILHRWGALNSCNHYLHTESLSRIACDLRLQARSHGRHDGAAVSRLPHRPPASTDERPRVDG
jgi:hypothetical protein